MNKLIASYLVLNVIFIFINAAMAGGGGLAATSLTASLSATATSMSVDDTTGFLSTDVVTIDEEQILYGSKPDTTSFADLTRGYNQTKANSHKAGKYVYSQETSMVNQALGFNVASTSSTAGTFAVIGLTWAFLTRSLLNIVVWDFPNIFSGEWIYIRIILMAIGAGLIIYIGIHYLLPAMGILRRT